MKKRYPSDLSDAEWSLVQPFFEPPRPKGGRPRVHSARHLLNAILYVMRNGCTWQALPDSFPPWSTVACARRRWTLDGTLERANGALARARGSAAPPLSIPSSSSRAMAARAASSTATSAPRA